MTLRLTMMKRTRPCGLRGAWLLGCWTVVAACNPSPSDAGSSGGSGGAGQTGDGGLGSGGLTTTGGGGSASSGGSNASGSGGVSTGGADSGTGGSTSGGDASGGDASGGSASGGTANFDPAFILGADISGAQESSASYVDTDGETKSLFALLQSHGFNFIRLRTFVDPGAPGGYASTANGCAGKPEEYGDKAHVIEYGKQAKDAGMGFLLDFHYSDVWADPGNQIIPESWRGATTTDELAALLKAYTKDVMEDAIAAGARPDLVQVGNEITPGMVAHLPGPDTDCWGNDPGSTSSIGGSNSSAAGWDRLAVLLQAGIEGVREVDPTIKVMLHVENTDDLSGVQWWVESAVSRGVDFDVLGLSCYTQFQGPPSTWENTFETMAADYPELEFMIAEYNPERTAANLLMKNLPDGRGLGTFFWEPTLSGEWGDSMFTWDGSAQVAIPSAFQEYDDMLADLGL
jgi:arabinogalactan endo-1,4-beta-galactosidase